MVPEGCTHVHCKAFEHLNEGCCEMFLRGISQPWRCKENGTKLHIYEAS